jgi:translation elongation factor EF-1beta
LSFKIIKMIWWLLGIYDTPSATYQRHISDIHMTTFYDNISRFFNTDVLIKQIAKEPIIFNLHSMIIGDYMDKMSGSNEYFEDKVMKSFDTFVNRCDNAEEYDEVCNNIIFIYYKSIKYMNDYYSDIYKKKRFYLENLP